MSFSCTTNLASQFRKDRGDAPVARSMHTPSKVTNLELAVEPEKEILWFNVSVNNMFAMQIFQCVRHLSNILREARQSNRF